MTTIERLRRLIRQQTVSVGRPVRNLHGGATSAGDRVVVTRTAEWGWLTIANVSLVSLDDFLTAFVVDGTHSVQIIQTTEGVGVVGATTRIIDWQRNDLASTFLLLGTVQVSHMQRFPLVVVSGTAGGEFALYVDGVLQRRGYGSLSYEGQLSAGGHTIALVTVVS